MNRLFGRAKPKEPPPNLTDCIAGVSFLTKSPDLMTRRILGYPGTLGINLGLLILRSTVELIQQRKRLPG